MLHVKQNLHKSKHLYVQDHLDKILSNTSEMPLMSQAYLPLSPHCPQVCQKSLPDHGSASQVNHNPSLS